MTFTYGAVAVWAERKRSHVTDGPGSREVHLTCREPLGRADRRTLRLSVRRRGRISASATPASVAYRDNVAADGIDTWPGAGFALLGELGAARGRVALIAATTPADADALVERLRTDLGVGVVRLGSALADRSPPPSGHDVDSACGEATVITDLDTLLWPEMAVAPLQLLSVRARRRPTLAVWPGYISGGRATYSTPGRPDYHDVPLRDSVVLRPRSTRFPDEVPFTIERILR